MNSKNGKNTIILFNPMPVKHPVAIINKQTTSLQVPLVNVPLSLLSLARMDFDIKIINAVVDSDYKEQVLTTESPYRLSFSGQFKSRIIRFRTILESNKKGISRTYSICAHMLPLLGTILAGLLSFLAGIFEDSESNAGSASNPNSQVQLAPQIGHRHRYFNKAISGEPPANALWATTAATVAVLLFAKFEAFSPVYSVIFSSVIGALVSTLLLGLYGIFSHISRIASMKTFKQTLYWDALYSALPLDLSFGFLTAFSLTLLSFTAAMMLNNPFSVPLIAFMLGITIGTIGSSTGDIHYGAERLYQHHIFGSGIPISNQGDIDVKGEYGYRNSVDTPYFTLRFGATITAFTFGFLIFLDSLSRVFDFAGAWTSVIVELGMILIIFIVTVYLEKYTRDKYGPFVR